jgi:hypothetical protein
MIKFERGDRIIGLPESDFKYKNTNSSSLLKVEEVYDWGSLKPAFGDLLVSVVAWDYAPFIPEKPKIYQVHSEYFRKATAEDIAYFTINLI